MCVYKSYDMTRCLCVYIKSYDMTRCLCVCVYIKVIV